MWSSITRLAARRRTKASDSGRLITTIGVSALHDRVTGRRADAASSWIKGAAGEDGPLDEAWWASIQHHRATSFGVAG
ncbi:MAG TPA: hypothetical protein VFZ68_01715 [Acidimicrobiales bacterium]